MKTAIGWLAVFVSAFFFYMASVVIRWSQPSVSLDPAFFVFSRLALGFVIVTVSLGIKRRVPRPNRFRYIAGRTVGNGLAVYFFYKAVDTTSLANANILNMTYPLFIAVITWLFLKENGDRLARWMVPVAFAGVWLIVAPEGLDWDRNNLWGLASGFSASFAIIYLNLCRRYDSSETTLFYMFGLGAILTWVLFHDRIFMPDRTEATYLMVCSLFGVGGQYLLTYGFRFVTAVEGSILSSTRILIAAIAGPFLVADPGLTAAGWMGALLLFGVNILLAVRKATAGEVKGLPL